MRQGSVFVNGRGM